jgi:RNA polymerase sigma-70 factor (ECF subfamily)
MLCRGEYGQSNLALKEVSIRMLANRDMVVYTPLGWYLPHPSRTHMNSPAFHSVQNLLEQAQQGDIDSRERLAQWMLENVNRLVSHVLKQRNSPLGHSSLTSEVLIKLVRGETIDRAPSVAYLVGAISQATREILIDSYRRYARRKKGFGEGVPADCPWFRKVEASPFDLLAMHDSLQRLEQIDSRKAAVVTLRYFCDLSLVETASELGISKSTVESDWRLARVWLMEELIADAS